MTNSREEDHPKGAKFSIHLPTGDQAYFHEEWSYSVGDDGALYLYKREVVAGQDRWAVRHIYGPATNWHVEEFADEEHD